VFKWIKGWIDWVKFGDEQVSGSTIKLPKEHLIPTMEYYSGKSERLPVQIVVIYNVKELAMELARYLNNNGDNSSGSPKDGKNGDDDSN